MVPAGRVSNKLLTTMNILPTLAELCGARLLKKRIEGVAWTALLKGNDSIVPRDEFYCYYRKNKLEAVRKGNWKLVFPHPGRSYEGDLPGQRVAPGLTQENREFPLALYNLERDPGERYDVSKLYPEVVTALNKLAEDARDDLGDDLQKRIGKNIRPSGLAR